MFKSFVSLEFSQVLTRFVALPVLVLSSRVAAGDALEVPSQFPSYRVFLLHEDIKDSTNRVVTVTSRDAADWGAVNRIENSSSTKRFANKLSSGVKNGSKLQDTSSSTNTTFFTSSNADEHWPTNTLITKYFSEYSDESGTARTQVWVNGVPDTNKTKRVNFVPKFPPSASATSNLLCRREYDLSSVSRSADGFTTTNVTGTATQENVPMFVVEFKGGDPRIKYRAIVSVKHTEVPKDDNPAREKVLKYVWVAMGEIEDRERPGTRNFMVPAPFTFECQTIEVTSVDTELADPEDELTIKVPEHKHN